MPPALRSIELPRQVTLPYVEQGDPACIPLLLLHGFTDSWRAFEPVLSHLPETIHAFALTQRGHGDASRPPSGYHLPDFVADVAGFMDALQLAAAVIVGGSSGGFVARRLPIDHPERTRGLVFLGSPGALRDKPAVLELWNSTIAKLTDPIDPVFVRTFQASGLARPVPPAFLETMVHESLKVPAFVWRATFEGLLDDDSFGHLNTIKVPSLIVWGDRDAFLPRSDQEALAAALAGSRLVVYPGAGHAVYWEEPARVASDLVAFIGDLGR
jgi:pimeloyl-ACP methyl ester carboxylesterase